MTDSERKAAAARAATREAVIRAAREIADRLDPYRHALLIAGYQHASDEARCVVEAEREYDQGP